MGSCIVNCHKKINTMNRENIYFSHDANAMSDPKCMLLIEQLGMEGYGMFWGLVEMLRQQPEYRLPLALLPAIAGRFKVSESKIKTVVSAYGLFIIENEEFFFSRSLRDRMMLMQEKRVRRQLAGIKSGEARRAKALAPKNEQCSNNVQAMFKQCSNNTEQRKEKKRKETEFLFDSSLRSESQINSSSPLTPHGGTDAASSGGGGDILNYYDLTPPADGIDRNFEALARRCKELGVPEGDFKAICRLTNFGRIGDKVWMILRDVEQRKGEIKAAGRYLTSLLLKEG